MPKKPIVCPSCGATIPAALVEEIRRATYSRPEDVVFAFKTGDAVFIAYGGHPPGKVIDRAVRPCHDKWLPWYKVEPLDSKLWRSSKWLSEKMLSQSSNESG
jgi:hypothetical protein